MKRILINGLLLMIVTGLALANIYVYFSPSHAAPELSKKAKPGGRNYQPANRIVKANINGLRDGFAVPKPTLPPSSSALLGVVLNGQRRFAIVQKKGGSADVLQEGSELDKMQIKRIAPKGLILEGAGVEKVKVFQKDE